MSKLTKIEAGWYQTEYQGQAIFLYQVTHRVTSVNGSKIVRYWEGRIGAGEPLGLGAGSRREAQRMTLRIVDNRF